SAITSAARTMRVAAMRKPPGNSECSRHARTYAVRLCGRKTPRASMTHTLAKLRRRATSGSARAIPAAVITGVIHYAGEGGDRDRRAHHRPEQPDAVVHHAGGERVLAGLGEAAR